MLLERESLDYDPESWVPISISCSYMWGHLSLAFDYSNFPSIHTVTDLDLLDSFKNIK